MSPPDDNGNVECIFENSTNNSSMKGTHVTQPIPTLQRSGSSFQSGEVMTLNGEAACSTSEAPLYGTSYGPLPVSSDECAPTPVISNRRPDLHALHRLPSEMNEMLTPPCLREPNGNYTLRSEVPTLTQTEQSRHSRSSSIEFRFSSETDDPIVMTAASLKERNVSRAHAKRHQENQHAALVYSDAESRTLCFQNVNHESSDAAFLIEMATRLSLNMVSVAYKTLRHTIIQNLVHQSASKSSREHTSQNGCVFSPCGSRAMYLPAHSHSVAAGTAEKSRPVRGIRNYGQTCFLNSVLQALASLESFTLYLQHVVDQNMETHDISSYTASRLETNIFGDPIKSRVSVPPISNCLFGILCSINGQDGDVTPTIDPRVVLRAVGQKHKQFQASYGAVTNADQQDAQELLQAVLGMVVDESHFEITPRVLPRSPESIPIDDFTITLASELIGIRTSKICGSDISLGVTNGIDHKHETIKSDGQSVVVPHIESMGLGEEKKQEEFELYLPRESSEQNISRFAHQDAARVCNGADSGYDETPRGPIWEARPTYSSKAIEIVMTTTSSISPCPLSGWCGSTLWCASCRRVRPIQNVPFLDIPIVPTSVSQSTGAFFTSKLTGTRDPPCSLEDCLKEYTRNELVREVECKNCSIQAEIEEQNFEKTLREQLIGRLLLRRSTLASTMSDDKTLNLLQKELISIQGRLHYLQRCCPDDDDPLLAMQMNDSIDEKEQDPIKLKRSDAIKCLILTRLPAVLSIHVQRRYYDQLSGRTSKTLQHVVFPEILDLSPFCAYGGELRAEAPFAGTLSKTKLKAKAPIKYKLMAIIEHLGGANSGHYVSYRRDPSSDSQWLWISDDKIKSCDWSTVRKCQAYMLFYEAM